MDKLTRQRRSAKLIVKCWHGFTPFLDDCRICLTSSAAERSLRGFALGRKSRLFAASDLGADRAAYMATLIIREKLNDIDPQAWPARSSYPHRRRADYKAGGATSVEMGKSDVTLRRYDLRP
jgi:hypothetical protein